MGFKEFASKSKRKYQDRGVETLPEIAQEFTLGAASRLLPIHRYGRRIYDHDWDILVVLDACRMDMYQDVVNADAGSAWSCAGTSTEWMEKNFVQKYSDEMAETAYISGNPFTEQIFGGKPWAEGNNADAGSAFGLLDEVWRYGWDDEAGTIPPEPLTDRAVRVGRENEYDRIIVHYMQPHMPFIGSDRTWGRMDVENFGEGTKGNVWYRAMLGEVDVDAVWEAYNDNLRFVWEYVETLLSNMDGDLVVTADHGNCLGEWGMWGHRGYVPAPALRRVPWDRYEAVDRETYEPSDISPESSHVSDEVNERLEQLGYK